MYIRLLLEEKVPSVSEADEVYCAVRIRRKLQIEILHTAHLISHAFA